MVPGRRAYMNSYSVKWERSFAWRPLSPSETELSGLIAQQQAAEKEPVGGELHTGGQCPRGARAGHELNGREREFRVTRQELFGFAGATQ